MLNRKIILKYPVGEQFFWFSKFEAVEPISFITYNLLKYNSMQIDIHSVYMVMKIYQNLREMFLYKRH